MAVQSYGSSWLWQFFDMAAMAVQSYGSSWLWQWQLFDMAAMTVLRYGGYGTSELWQFIVMVVFSSSKLHELAVQNCAN